MRIHCLRSAAVAVLFLQATPLQAGDRAKPGEVGDQLSRMLQNSHFENQRFNEMGPRFLDDYLSELDPDRLYFSQADVDQFHQLYGKALPRLLLTKKAPEAAEAIYAVFRKRVEARVAQAKQLLAGPDFDFTGDESIPLLRKAVPWPKDEAQAMTFWQLAIKEAVLSENLRRAESAKHAKEQGKLDPLATALPPKELVARRFDRLLRRVTEDTRSEDIAAMFFSAVTQAYDPHSDYMTDPQMDRFKDGMRNELVGIGAQLRATEEGPTVITGILIGGPADRQGDLKPNDRVLAVDPDGQAGPQTLTRVMFMDDDKVVDLIRGVAGTRVTLEVQAERGAPDQTALIEIVRAKVDLKASQASTRMIQSKDASGENTRLGVITLPLFYTDFDAHKTGCTVDVEKLLKRLMQENIDGLILDLRGNGGGSLPEVQSMAGLFVGDAPVVQVKDRFGRVEVLESEIKEPLYTGPMIVLTDKTSASASEILAGALQDMNRAVIVGQSSTFGKGTVQRTLDVARMMPWFSASEGAGTLKLTVQKFYRPAGSSTQNQGVIPDIVLPNARDVFEIGETFLKHPLAHDFIPRAGGLKPLDRDQLAVPRLKELSEARVKASKDFADLSADIAREKARRQENRVSLNAAAREREAEEIDQRLQARNAERGPRFAALEAADREALTFYKLTLDDLAAGKPLVAFDPSQPEAGFIREAEDESTKLDLSPEWPSSLDLQERESLMVLADMIEIERSSRLAGSPERKPVR